MPQEMVINPIVVDTEDEGKMVIDHNVNYLANWDML